MTLTRFATRTVWIFDLDNTLYTPDNGIFAQVNQRMRTYVADKLSCSPDDAHRVQKAYFRDHGSTLKGLIDEHGVDPHDFLDFVHDIDLTPLRENAGLADAIARLPGRKIIFTNSDAPYARRVLERLGLHATFDALHDIHATAYIPKPHADAYASLCASCAIDPKDAVFIEDTARNLGPAKAMGMGTVWLNNDSELGNYGHRPDDIDLQIDALEPWLLHIGKDNIK